MYNWEPFLKNHPTAAEALYQWGLQYLLNWQASNARNVPTGTEVRLEEIKYEDAKNYMLGTMVLCDRILYDFFDHYKMVITVSYDWEGGFSAVISGEEPDFAAYHTRQEAERVIFEQAFKILEDELNRQS